MRPSSHALVALVGLLAVVGCGTGGSPSAPGAEARPAALPAAIRLTIEGATGSDGFCAARGETNLPPGARLLVTIAAAPDRGSDLVENAVVDVGPDGRFVHRSLLAFPVLYRLRAEFSAAADPDHAAWFATTPIAAEGGATVETAGGGPRVLAAATWRIGTEADEAALVTSRADALAAVLSRLRYDREQVDQKVRPPAADAARAYVKWARIRAEKAHSMKLDRPAVDPLFGSLDLALRRLWATLDEVGLAALASAVGDETETKRLADAAKRFDRLYDEAAGDLARIQGQAK